MYEGTYFEIYQRSQSLPTPSAKSLLRILVLFLTNNWALFFMNQTLSSTKNIQDSPPHQRFSLANVYCCLICHLAFRGKNFMSRLYNFQI